jgi:hypothetical protein
MGDIMKNYMGEWEHLLEEMYRLLLSVSEPQKQERPEGWSVQQVVGHLIDSACNNHNRFLRYNPKETVRFPAYNPDQCVQRNAYNTYNYKALVELWYSYNHLILHSVKAMPEAALQCEIQVGDGDVMKYRELIADYFSHMRIHQKQIQRILKN